MATYAFPDVTPNTMEVQLVSNTAIFKSPLSSAIQTLDRGGEHIMVTMTFRGLRSWSNINADTSARSLLTGFIAKLNGRQHRFTMKMFCNSKLGQWANTVLVAGANQLGTTLDVDAAGAGSFTPFAHQGDWFSVNGELKICTATVAMTSDAATLEFSPRLRTAPPDNDPVTHTDPTGTFMLLDDPVWTNYPGQSTNLSDLTIRAIEDVAA